MPTITSYFSSTSATRRDADGPSDTARPAHVTGSAAAGGAVAAVQASTCKVAAACAGTGSHKRSRQEPSQKQSQAHPPKKSAKGSVFERPTASGSAMSSAQPACLEAVDADNASAVGSAGSSDDGPAATILEQENSGRLRSSAAASIEPSVVEFAAAADENVSVDAAHHTTAAPAVLVSHPSVSYEDFLRSLAATTAESRPNDASRASPHDGDCAADAAAVVTAAAASPHVPAREQQQQYRDSPAAAAAEGEEEDVSAATVTGDPRSPGRASAPVSRHRSADDEVCVVVSMMPTDVTTHVTFANVPAAASELAVADGSAMTPPAAVVKTRRLRQPQLTSSTRTVEKTEASCPDDEVSVVAADGPTVSAMASAEAVAGSCVADSVITNVSSRRNASAAGSSRTLHSRARRARGNAGDGAAAVLAAAADAEGSGGDVVLVASESPPVICVDVSDADDKNSSSSDSSACMILDASANSVSRPDVSTAKASSRKSRRSSADSAKNNPSSATPSGGSVLTSSPLVDTLPTSKRQKLIGGRVSTFNVGNDVMSGDDCRAFVHVQQLAVEQTQQTQLPLFKLRLKKDVPSIGSDVIAPTAAFSARCLLELDSRPCVRAVKMSDEAFSLGTVRELLKDILSRTPGRAVNRSYKRLRTRAGKPMPARVDGTDPADPSLERSPTAIDVGATSAGNATLTGDELWTEKYRPQKSDELLGNSEAVAALRQWLSDWRTAMSREPGASAACTPAVRDASGVKRKSCQLPVDSSDDSNSWDAPAVDDRYNLAIITGPSGCGKTAAVYAVAAELGFKVFELNPSSARSYRNILDQVGEATVSHHFESSPVPLTGGSVARESEPLCNTRPGGLLTSSATAKKRPPPPNSILSFFAGKSKSVPQQTAAGPQSLAVACSTATSVVATSALSKSAAGVSPVLGDKRSSGQPEATDRIAASRSPPTSLGTHSGDQQMQRATAAVGSDADAVPMSGVRPKRRAAIASGFGRSGSRTDSQSPSTDTTGGTAAHVGDGFSSPVVCVDSGSPTLLASRSSDIVLHASNAATPIVATDSTAACTQSKSVGALGADQQVITSAITSSLARALQTPSGSSLTSQSIVLFDEADVIFEEDRGFWSAVQTLLRDSKKPIILTATSAESLQGLKTDRKLIKMELPPACHLAAYLAEVCAAEDVAVNFEHLQQLVHSCSCDIRRSLLQLQCLVQSGSLDARRSAGDGTEAQSADHGVVPGEKGSSSAATPITHSASRRPVQHLLYSADQSWSKCSVSPCSHVSYSSSRDVLFIAPNVSQPEAASAETELQPCGSDLREQLSSAPGEAAADVSSLLLGTQSAASHLPPNVLKSYCIRSDLDLMEPSWCGVSDRLATSAFWYGGGGSSSSAVPARSLPHRGYRLTPGLADTTPRCVAAGRDVAAGGRAATSEAVAGNGCSSGNLLEDVWRLASQLSDSLAASCSGSRHCGHHSQRSHESQLLAVAARDGVRRSGPCAPDCRHNRPCYALCRAVHGNSCYAPVSVAEAAVASAAELIIGLGAIGETAVAIGCDFLPAIRSICASEAARIGLRGTEPVSSAPEIFRRTRRSVYKEDDHALQELPAEARAALAASSLTPSTPSS